MALPNPAMSFSPFAILTAEEQNDLVENIESLADGTGIANIEIGAGHTSLKNDYKFSAYINTAQNTLANNWLLVQLDTELFDSNSNFDIVTHKGRYTAPVSGFYQINSNITIASGSNISETIAIYKNGSSLHAGPEFNVTSGGGGYIGTNISQLIQLTAGDYIEIFVYCNSTVAIQPSAVNSYFSGYLVSAA